MAFPPRWEVLLRSMVSTQGIPRHAEVKHGPVLTLVFRDFYCFGESVFSLHYAELGTEPDLDWVLWN